MKHFEWDKQKHAINLKKHHIDFIDAIKVFDDDNRIELENEKNGEVRYETIGIIEEVAIFVVYTYRNKKRRIISARRASKAERKTYYHLEVENEKQN